jgi:histidinol-phosphate/aromatic aminotransferase/cobyric acid decarboxylase-like protein
MLQYGPSRGFEPLRQWLAEWQGVALDRVMTSNGSLQLIEFLCLQMLKPGDPGFHRVAELRPHDQPAAAARREGRGHSARG